MRLVPTALAAAALPLLAACSPFSGTGHPGISTGKPASPALLNGAQLKAALAPASFFPAGYTLDPTGSVNTGPDQQAASPPPSRRPDCAKLEGTSWVVLAAPGSVAFAENDYLDKAKQEYAQEIDSYPGTGAEQVMASLRKVAAACATYHEANTSARTTVKLRGGPPLGDDALTLVLANPSFEGGITLEAVRVGTAVITVQMSALSGTGQSQATSLATRITRDLRARSSS